MQIYFTIAKQIKLFIYYVYKFFNNHITYPYNESYFN